MEALIIELRADEDPGRLFVLADEIAEDARCSLELLGRDAGGALLISIWDPDTVDEVEHGLRSTFGDAVRRMEMMDPRQPQ